MDLDVKTTNYKNVNFMKEIKRPKVGIGVAVIKGNKILFGKRKKSHGDGCWSFPGGHLEFNEEICDCATREVAEETGLQIKNIKHWVFTNDIFKQEDKHYVTLFVLAEVMDGGGRT